MLKHFFLVLLFTFVVGLFTGIYAFFVTSGPRDVEIEEPVVTEDSFEIVADMYGGCQMLGMCPSYRVTETGEYTYIVHMRDGEDQRFEGTLSETQLEDLVVLIEETDLEELEDTIFEGACPAAFDDAAYTYAIVTNGGAYDFDTCAEDIFGVPLFVTLENYFEIFSLLHEN